jgi:hypothetical protein
MGTVAGHDCAHAGTYWTEAAHSQTVVVADDHLETGHDAAAAVAAAAHHLEIGHAEAAADYHPEIGHVDAAYHHEIDHCSPADHHEIVHAVAHLEIGRCCHEVAAVHLEIDYYAAAHLEIGHVVDRLAYVLAADFHHEIGHAAVADHLEIVHVKPALSDHYAAQPRASERHTVAPALSSYYSSARTAWVKVEESYSGHHWTWQVALETAC